jgi:hypothetical protein
VVLLHAGCAAPPAAQDAKCATPPTDFTLSVAVMSHSSHRRVAPAVPRELRPMRFVMETDWVLRSYAGPGAADTDTFPAETRQLDAPQVASLWSDLQSAGLLAPDNPAIVGRAPTLAEVDPAKPVWVISYSADAAHRTLVLDAGADSPAAALVTRLADLAWIPK